VTDLVGPVQRGFVAAGIPADLVDELLEAFAEAKRRYYRDDLRPNAVEGGRFSEAAFRILQWVTDGGKYTPVGRALPTVDQLLVRFANATGPAASLRLHIPRTLRLIYDIRNTRDAAHLADGIDPNVQDATLVVHNMNWVLAELVRLFHDVSPAEAYRTITELVSKEVPVIQEFDGFPRILRDLKASDHVLVLLYWRGAEGALVSELAGWVPPTMRAHLRRTVAGLDGKHMVYVTGDLVRLTRVGEDDVERRGLIEPG
jgi:hypothetical protein